MYNPKGNGKDRTVETVHFVEAEPPVHLRGIVHRFLELRTKVPLQDDYRFHALPDACTYMAGQPYENSLTGNVLFLPCKTQLNYDKIQKNL